MKLLLAIFNLLLSVIIIKNWALINSNSCNYGPLSLEDRTKLFIFKLFYGIVFVLFIAFLIFFLVIYQSKFWGLFSVLYLHIY